MMLREQETFFLVLMKKIVSSTRVKELTPKPFIIDRIKVPAKRRGRITRSRSFIENFSSINWSTWIR